MNIPRFIARLVVHRPVILIIAILVILIGGGWVVKTRGNFDSEVLNLLPSDLRSVGALGQLHKQFNQSQALTFALQGDPEVISDFEEHFVTSLRAEPWVQRVFTGPPFEVPSEMAVLQKLVPSLLLNLEPAAFQEALRTLEPAAIRTQLHDLRQKTDAGSTRAEFQLSTDPLGLLGRSIQPLTTAYSEDEAEASGSADPSLKVYPAMSSEPSETQPECVALMAKVEDFQKRVVASWDGPAPKILVTGRTAYVAQMSVSMERDIKTTSTISILAVSALFFLGFRRIMPLVGLTVILGMSCFTAFVLGCLFFNSLNVIAIAFCSILVGLGDDFSLLLYNRYLHARQKHEDHETAIATSIGEAGKGICYVAITTGLGFMALIFSGSKGFAQLGMLIATGLILCAGFMILLLFLFIRPQVADERPDPFHRGVDRYLRSTWRRPGSIGISALIVCLAATLFAVLPLRPLRFDTNPRSLEPKDIPAAMALKSIIDAFAKAGEPVVLLMRTPDVADSHAQWTKMNAHLQTMVDKGELKSFSSPLGLMLSPQRQRENLIALQSIDLDASRAAFDEALQQEEFNPDAFAEARAVFDRLKEFRNPDVVLPDLKSLIPPTSSWWFLIDRFFSADPHLAAAYVKPTQVLATAEDQKRLEDSLDRSGLPVVATGWGYAMVSLVPWAKRELLIFGSLVGGLILVLLAVAYRAWRPWLVHMLSLLFALAATIATLKLAGFRINLLNAMAFPLILGVGVDYGLHLLLAMREKGDLHENLSTVLKPVIICGLTTMTGFGSLIFANNPALSGLGLVCAVGVFWCLVTSLLFLIPAAHLLSVGKKA